MTREPVTHDRRRGRPKRGLARAGILVTIVTPALWIGGAPPLASLVTAVLVAATALALALPKGARSWRVPPGLWIGLAALALTTLQLLPLPPVVTDRLQPAVVDAMHAAGVEGWRPLSLSPLATRLEWVELGVLALVYVVAAQFSWRRVATAVMVAALLVAVTGLIHELGDLHLIYGVYRPRLGRTGAVTLMTSFVNPNHQADLLGLGAACAFAVGRSLRGRAERSTDANASVRDRDLALACFAAAGALLATSLLSISRGALVSQAIGVVLVAVLVLRSGSGTTGDDSGTKSTPARLGRVLATLAPVALVVIVARLRGVWHDLSTLTDLDAAAEKPTAVLQGLGALGLSPWFGVGRGAFVDAFPLVDPRTGGPTFTHLESIPATMLVEWGPIGVVLAIALAWWWIRTFRARPSVSMRIAMVGLLVVALHGLLEFSFDLLGVAVPVVALAGSLAPRREDSLARQPPRRAVAIVVAATVCLGLVWTTARDGTFATRRMADARIADAPPPEPARESRWIADRPLDGHLHLALARAHADAHQWDAATSRARSAFELAPGQSDAWIVASHAEASREGGDLALSRTWLLEGLSHLGQVPPPDFADYIATRIPEPDTLALALTQRDADLDAALFLARGLLADHPAHAEALARDLTDRRPMDPEVLDLRTRATLATGQTALALHFARLRIQLDRNAGQAYVLFDRAMAARRPRRPGDLDERIRRLESALPRGGLRDLGDVEEALIRALVERGRPEDVERARELGLRLLHRPAKATVQARRRQLVDGLDHHP